MPTQSKARLLAEAVADLLATELAGRATVQKLWHPSFAAKELLEDVIVTVRPARRRFRAEGKFVGVRTVDLEIGVVRKLPKVAASSDDPFNQMAEIDTLDLLAADIFDMFCRVDEEDSPESLLASQTVAGYTPTPPEQPAVFDPDLMENDRIFLTVITVPYELME